MTQVSTRSRFLTTQDRRLLYARLIALALSFLLGLLILGYTLYFYYVFEAAGNTTSYFPWAWQVYLDKAGPVMKLTGVGLALSIGLSSVTGAGAVVIFRAMRRSPDMLEKQEVGVIVSSKPYRRKLFGLEGSTLASIVALGLDLAGIAIALKVGDNGALLPLATGLIIAGLLGAAYFALDTFLPSKRNK